MRVYSAFGASFAPSFSSPFPIGARPFFFSAGGSVRRNRLRLQGVRVFFFSGVVCSGAPVFSDAGGLLVLVVEGGLSRVVEPPLVPTLLSTGGWVDLAAPAAAA